MTIDLANVAGLLSDLDGVWFVGGQPVPGAVDALATLRARALSLRFITNTTTKTRDQISRRLGDMGLMIGPEEIINAPQAAALYLETRGKPSVHCIVSDAVRPAFDAFPSSDQPDYVVIGDINGGWNYTLMNDAFRMLIGGAELVAMHKGRYWQTADGLTLDIGAFVIGLEYAASKTAIVVGKPAPTIFLSTLDSMGLTADRVVMVGDDIHADIGGAQAAGIAAVLVRTGKFRGDLVSASGVTPDMVVDGIADLVRRL